MKADRDIWVRRRCIRVEGPEILGMGREPLTQSEVIAVTAIYSVVRFFIAAVSVAPVVSGCASRSGTWHPGNHGDLR